MKDLTLLGREACGGNLEHQVGLRKIALELHQTLLNIHNDDYKKVQLSEDYHGIYLPIFYDSGIKIQVSITTKKPSTMARSNAKEKIVALEREIKLAKIKQRIEHISYMASEANDEKLAIVMEILGL